MWAHPVNTEDEITEAYGAWGEFRSGQLVAIFPSHIPHRLGTSCWEQLGHRTVAWVWCCGGSGVGA